MRFTVDYSKANKQETKYMPVGEHVATIKLHRFREVERVETFNNGQQKKVNYNHINLLLENAKGEIVWDTIYQNLNETQEYLVYDERKLNQYSFALQIPEGTDFNTIEEWLRYIEGRQVLVNVIENNWTNAQGQEINGVKVYFVDIAKKEPIQGGLAF